MRQRPYLIHRYRTLLSYSGLLWLTIGLVIAVPLVLLPFYPDESGLADGFLLGAVPLVLLGLVSWRIFKPEDDFALSVGEGMVIVAVAWILAILAGTVPFLVETELDLTQAVFESTSGWTTTGLSVVDVTEMPHLILFYRSLLQFVGGAGIAIIMLSALTSLAGAGLSVAEGRSEQLAPHVRSSANIVLTLYSTYTLAGIVALRVAGMGWFDALNHAFSAISTGGFSTRPESIGYWDSTLVEAVVIVLMLLGAVNFLTAYTLLRGKPDAVRRNGELRLMALVLPVMAFLLFLSVTHTVYDDLGKQARVAIFEATSAFSTTGFATVSYTPWDEVGWLILIVLMLIGGGTASTAGGIKQLRIYVVFRAMLREIGRPLRPQHHVYELEIWRGDRRRFLSETQVNRVAMYVFLYMTALFLGAGLVAAHGHSLGASLFEFASTVGTVGLSVGLTGPETPATMLWVQTIGMLLGRLEFMTLAVGLAKLASDAVIIFRIPADS